MHYILIGWSLLFNSNSCDGRIAIDDISQHLEVSISDKKFVDIFQVLDGVWQGNFNIYFDNHGQMKDLGQPLKIDYELYWNLDLQLQNVQKVQQL